MSVSKVEFDDRVLINLEHDTIVASGVKNGLTFHSPNGDISTGSAPVRTSDDVSIVGPSVSIPSGFIETPITRLIDSGEITTGDISVSASGLASIDVNFSPGYISEGPSSPITKQLNTRSGDYPLSLLDRVIPANSWNTGMSNVEGVTGDRLAGLDSNFKASNIAEGVIIFGVEGTHSGGSAPVLQEKTATLQTKIIASQPDYDDVLPDAGYDGLSKVTVPRVKLQTIAASLSTSAQTIRKTLADNIGLQQVSIPAVKASTLAPLDSNFVAENIKSGVTIFGLEGAYTPPTPTGNYQEKTAVLSKTAGSVIPDAGFDALSKVNIPAVTGSALASLDSNFKASNIAEGVTIFGVEGTHSGGGGGPVLLASANLGTISSTSTSAASATSVTITVPGIENYDNMYVEAVRSAPLNNYHYSTGAMYAVPHSRGYGTFSLPVSYGTARMNKKYSKSYGYVVASGAYGVYPNSLSLSGTSITFNMYKRYNSSTTGTLNGTYTLNVYGF